MFRAWDLGGSQGLWWSAWEAFGVERSFFVPSVAGTAKGPGLGHAEVA